VRLDEGGAGRAALAFLAPEERLHLQALLAEARGDREAAAARWRELRGGRFPVLGHAAQTHLDAPRPPPGSAGPPLLARRFARTAGPGRADARAGPGSSQTPGADDARDRSALPRHGGLLVASRRAIRASLGVTTARSAMGSSMEARLRWGEPGW
jgi:hypothetical protein